MEAAYNAPRSAPGPRGHWLLGSIPAFEQNILGAIEEGRATYGDLVPLCADLPASTPVIARPQPAAAATAPPAVVSPVGYLAGLPAGLKILWTIWLTAVSVNVVVWALVSGTGSHLAYPWPVWVAGPYGAVLFAVSAGVVLFRRSRSPIARPRPVNS